MKLTMLVLVCAIILPVGHALTGYDCGRHAPNITTFSLREVAQCESHDTDPEVTNVDLILLQRVDHRPMLVQTCRVKVARRICYCDWQGYASTIEESTYYEPVSREACEEMVAHGRFEFEKIVLRDLLPNATNYRSLTVVGEMESDGDCSGGTYTSNDKVYKKAVVMAKVELDFSERTAQANVDTKEIHLPSGTRCLLASARCIDANQNNAYWIYTPRPTCDFEQYAVLFEGKGVRVSDNITHSPDVYFGNSSKEIQFGLTRVGEFSLCGYKVIRTEHPKLYIAEYAPGRGPPARPGINVEDVILTAYFNTKIQYQGRHIKQQFQNLYRDVLLHRCRLERGVIKNSLLHINSKPDVVAMTIMKRTGYMAVKSGEVAHMIACEPTACKIRHLKECFQEIPVTCRNETFFLKPQSHVMTRAGTPVDCNSILPAVFNIDGVWHQFTPSISRAREPQVLRPMSAPTWHYQDLEGQLESGIYTPKDLERLQEHFLFPAERPALLEEVARRLSDKATTSTSYARFGNLLDRASIEAIADSRLRKLWDGFTQFGIYAAGIMGVITIFHFIKLVIDTLIRGYTLRSLYGWSIHVIGAVWGSVTHLLVTMAHVKERDSNRAPGENPPPHIVTQEPRAPYTTNEEEMVIDIEKRLAAYRSKAGAI